MMPHLILLKISKKLFLSLAVRDMTLLWKSERHFTHNFPSPRKRYIVPFSEHKIDIIIS